MLTIELNLNLVLSLNQWVAASVAIPLTPWLGSFWTPFVLLQTGALEGGGGFGQATEVLGEALLGDERRRPNKDRSRAPTHPRALGTDRR